MSFGSILGVLLLNIKRHVHIYKKLLALAEQLNDLETQGRRSARHCFNNIVYFE